MLSAKQIIDLLSLEPLEIEGGHYRQTYCAHEDLQPSGLPARYKGLRPMGTAIYFMLTSDPDSFSAFHRLQTDEIYHFYFGDPVEMFTLNPAGQGERIVLGHDLLANQHVQFVVPSGVWQGSRLIPGGKYALMGTTMAPGFDLDDFTLGDRQSLTNAFPEHASIISELTHTDT